MKFKEYLNEIKVLPLKPQTVVSVLRNAGVVIQLTPKPKLKIKGRGGAYIKKVNPHVVAVQWMPWGENDNTGFDYQSKSVELESILINADFKVNRPYPDKTILAVTREAK